MSRHKKEHIKNSMLAFVRERCALGSPPKEYNQNCKESINSMIKRSKRLGKISLIQTVQLLQKEVNLHEDKAKLAMIGKGKYNISKYCLNYLVDSFGKMAFYTLFYIMCFQMTFK